MTQERLTALEDVAALATIGATYPELMLYLQAEMAKCEQALAAQPEQEPVAMLFGSLPVYDTAAQWDKPSASFDAWWDGDYDDSANPYHTGTPAYWAWAGWQAAQRKWQGLTDDEINGIAKNYALTNPTTPLHFARAIEAKLKAKND